MTRQPHNPKPRGRPAVITPARAARLQFPCQTCGAGPGDICRGPSGWPTQPEHADRFTRAAAAQAAKETTP